MNVIIVVVLSIYLTHIHTENIYLNPGEEQLHSVFAGDDLTLLCPVNNTNGPIKWSFSATPADTILSDGMKYNSATFRFNVSFTNNLKQFIYLRIYNISLNEQHVYKCYYPIPNGFVEYYYTVKLANIPNVFIKENGTICCAVNGNNINATSFTWWEQRTLFDEHIRFIKSDKIKRSEMLKSSQPMFCLNTSGLVTYIRKERYICMAQIFINGRKQPVNRNTSIEKHNIADLPLCIQDKRIQRSIIGSNISIVTNFYSKSEYYNISVRKEYVELKLDKNLSVSSKNISVDILDVTETVSGYETTINIIEFSDENIGNYTIEMHNEFGYAMCTVQLLPHGKKDHSGMVETDATENRAKEIKYLQWYMMACGSLIVIFVAMFALRSTFLKTVKDDSVTGYIHTNDAYLEAVFNNPNDCSKTTIWKPRFQKRPATRIKRRAYSDQFMEVTLNELNNGERILIIGQTNEMDASTETNI